ncbi:MAG: DUF2064 domain-containing protein [Cyclobacteriaceae bacterium]
MNPEQNDIAILFFSRTEKEEIRHKKFIDGDQSRANLQVSKSLISGTRKILKKSNYDYHTFSEDKQKGNSFGERFSNALSEVFSTGCNGVIAIGNDCPQLSINDIDRASNSLKNGQDVLGPATDGGIYLLGIRKDDFDANSLNQLSWQSGDLFRDINEYFSSKDSRVDLLETKRDIDNEADLKEILKLETNNTIVKSLQKIFIKSQRPKISSYIDAKIINTFHRSLGLRGPPRLSH